MSIDTVAFNVSVFISALYLLERGADLFIDSTAALSTRLAISQILIALLTAGAEWEELAVVVAAVAQGRPKLAFGNVVGSCVSNILGAFSLGLLVSRAVGGSEDGDLGRNFDRSAKLYTSILFGVTSLLSVLLATVVLRRSFGGILIATFGVYVALVAWSIYRGILTRPEDSDSDSDSNSDSALDAASNNSEDVSSIRETTQATQRDRNLADSRETAVDDAERRPLLAQHRRSRPRTAVLIHSGKLALGFFALSISGYLLSHSSITLARSLNISESSFAATILSLATTLPEKVVAVMSGYKGHSGILVANTVGSNIFLLTLCLGVHVSGVETFDARIYLHEIVWMWASSAVLLAVVFFGSRRWIGLLMLVAYVAFIVIELVLYRR